MLILIAEDNPMIAAAIKLYLEDSEIHAMVASTAKEAIDLFTAWHYDGAVVDVNLFTSSGMDVIDFMREKCEKIHIVATTGYRVPDVIIELAKKEVPLLVKPFEMKDLWRELRLEH